MRPNSDSKQHNDTKTIKIDMKAGVKIISYTSGKSLNDASAILAS